MPRRAMSALGQKADISRRPTHVRLPPKADINRGERYVCFAPIADITPTRSLRGRALASPTKTQDRARKRAWGGLFAAAPLRLLDLPRRIMRDVHRGVATRPSQCRHSIACKWLAPGDPCILPGATGDDVSAAIQGWLRLVDVAGIEGRENLVAVGICQDARSINVFFGA